MKEHEVIKSVLPKGIDESDGEDEDKNEEKITLF